MKIALCFLFPAISVFSACASRGYHENARPKVIGGEVATEGMFPATVNLVVRDPDGSERNMCSATKIGARVFLTASHCVVTGRGHIVAHLLPEAELGIFAGITLGATKAKYVRVVRTVAHSTFIADSRQATPIFNTIDPKAKSVQDLALFFVDRDTADIPIAKLASASAKLGDPVTYVGYGCEDDGTLRSRQKYAHFMITDVQGEYFQFLNFSDEKKSAGCQGDSGGSAYVTPAADTPATELLGVISQRLLDSTLLARVDEGAVKARAWVTDTAKMAFDKPWFPYTSNVRCEVQDSRAGRTFVLPKLPLTLENGEAVSLPPRIEMKVSKNGEDETWTLERNLALASVASYVSPVRTKDAIVSRTTLSNSRGDRLSGHFESFNTKTKTFVEEFDFEFELSACTRMK